MGRFFDGKYKKATLYDIVYTYGTPGDGKNGAGRIVTIDQGQGFKVDNFTYDELGQRASEFATVQVPQVGTRTYGTDYVYSSLGRILQATYPDGDVVDYTYTNKGELYRIESTTPGDPSIYLVEQIHYDGFGQIGKLKYGNGTETSYNYASSAFTGLSLDDLNKSSLYASSVDGKATQGGSTTTLVDRDYQYSNLGMVSWLHKGVHSSLTAGVSTLDYSFSYDEKGRLSGSTLATGGSTIYQMTMGYNAAGGITSKASVRPGAHPLVDPNLDYELSYTYNPTKPHQLLSVSDAGPNGGLTRFTYDGVGNLMNMSGPSGAEELIWNELQQLSGVKNRNGIHHYVYDHSGERIMKSSINRSSVQVNDQTIDDIPYLEPYTLYVNPYFVVTSFHNGDRASKHYYMNTQRVATDISINYQGPPPPAAQGAQGTLNGTQTNPIGLSASFEQDINQVMQQFGAGEIAGDLAAHAIAIENYYPKAPAESESTNRILYWYHHDYLGSVDLVTDRNGLAYEFFLYTPWGEDMYHYNAGSSSFSSPYRFNGKELDGETRLFYYGARYYDPKTSNWLSVDPLKGNNPHLTPYNFVSNNPIMRIDPDGMDDGWVEGEGGEMTYDPDVHSQQDLVDQGKSGTYKGEKGQGYNPETGNQVYYGEDGESFEFPQMLGEVEVDGGKMSDHARTMQNPIVQKVYKGQRDFLRGSFLLTAHVTGQVGTWTSYIGYGAAFIPGAQPIAGGLIATGNTLSTVSSASTALINMSDGDYTGAVLNGANAFIPGRVNKLIDQNVARGVISTQGGNILKGGANMKSGVADYLINL